LNITLGGLLVELVETKLLLVGGVGGRTVTDEVDSLLEASFEISHLMLLVVVCCDVCDFVRTHNQKEKAKKKEIFYDSRKESTYQLIST